MIMKAIVIIKLKPEKKMENQQNIIDVVLLVA